MSNIFNRIGRMMSQILFSLITPPLLMPKIARLQVTRKLIAFCFGRLYGNKYDDLIGALGDEYGIPMSSAIKKAKEVQNMQSPVILDCGTGTGFVTGLAGEAFPDSMIIATDALPNMLELARKNCRAIESRVLHVRADTFSLPLADESVDLVLAQNTMPCFSEFCRVLRPGGMLLYVDTSAGWIAGLARRLVDRHRLFDMVIGERAGIGFYVLSQKAFVQGNTGEQVFRNDIRTLLRCPIDKGDLTFSERSIRCESGHNYPITDGFPVLLRDISRRD